MRILLGITGASGSVYARRLLGFLAERGIETHCALSSAARVTWRWELGGEPEEALTGSPCVRLYGEDDLMSPMASGSFRHDGMAIVPCSMRTLGALAGGIAQNLVQRAAEVCLKERRKLVLVVRESPYSLTHLENMVRVTQAGAVVLPASPGFYHRPRTMDDLVDFIVSRALDHLGIGNELIRRWDKAQQEAPPSE
ncbi:MAG: UbiX family flavin prenyltransferase [Candidatus Wallbacteria bacterium]|nr:UbiX family flavin prenyltransferase [Candidatus Wallbacteria bacterium]